MSATALPPAGLVKPITAMTRHLRGHRGLMVTVVATIWATMALSVAATALSVAAASAVVASLPGPDGPPSPTGLLIVLCAVVLALGASSWMEQWFAHVLAYRVLNTIRILVHRAIARLAPLGLADRAPGDTVAAAMTDVESLEWFYAHTAAQVLAGLSGCLVMSALALLWLGPWALIVPLAQLVVILIPVLLLPVAAGQGARLRAAVTGLSALALSARTYARESVLLGRLERLADEAARATREIQSARQRLALRAGCEQAATEAVTVLLVLGTVALAVRAASQGSLEAGLVPVVVALAGTALLPALAVTGAMGRLGETAAASARVDALIRARGTRPTAPQRAQDGAPQDRPRLGEVRLVGVTVRYPGGAPVLTDLHLLVPGGQLLGVVGASGAGKSTLGLVLARLLEPERGRLLVNGVDTALQDPRLTREHLLLVSQHAHVLRASVRDNLLAPCARDEEIWDALERARLAERVRALPEGLDTVLAERGAAWSGGERQRLALARGLLRDPDVLVLDEPTAGLDTRTEAELLEALVSARRGRTTIVITHRTAVMRACERLVLLSDGAVAADGEPGWLERTSPALRALIDLEAQGDRPRPVAQPRLAPRSVDGPMTGRR